MKGPPGAQMSVSRFFLLLFVLCMPVWVIGAVFDVQLALAALAGEQLEEAGTFELKGIAEPQLIYAVA